MKKNIRSILAVILAVILVALVGTYAILKVRSKDSKTPAETSSESQSESAQSTAPESTSQETATQTEKTTTQQTTKASTGGVTEYAYAYAGFSPKVTKIDESKWYLTLVNRDYILPADYTVKTAKTVVDIYGGYDYGLLDYRVAPHYIEMYNAALEDGIKLSPLSGYRSIAHQKRNFEARISLYMKQGYSKKQATIMASEIILPPQTSEHNAGSAWTFSRYTRASRTRKNTDGSRRTPRTTALCSDIPRTNRASRTSHLNRGTGAMSALRPPRR